MAGLITAIKRIFKPQRCTACKMDLEDAIKERVALGECCNRSDCTFKEEIRRAILESKTPEVILWNVDRTKILENENITFFWEVLYAKKITISNLGEIPLKGNRTISPQRNTTYVLTIQDYKDNIYEVEEQICINVTPLPTIKIREEILKIERGDSQILYWNATNVSKIILSFDNRIIDVTNLVEYAVQPIVHTTYKLTFIALDNRTTIEKNINIEIFPKPEIKLFDVSPEVVISSIPVTISWRVENAKKIEINNGVGKVNEVGNKTILHDKNTLYRITAWGELSSVTKEIVVKVFPTPIIESLLVPMPDFESRININPIIINPPKIDVAIKMTDLNITQKKIIEPDIDLQTITPIYRKRLSIFNFSKIYECFKGRK